MQRAAEISMNYCHDCLDGTDCLLLTLLISALQAKTSPTDLLP